jgi:hypothetical protein
MNKEFIKTQYYKLFNDDSVDFMELASDIFKYQSEANPVYRQFLKLTGKENVKIESISDFPFMPISFFKTNEVKTGNWKHALHFESSTTSGSAPSIHLVSDLNHYLKNTELCYQYFYGDVRDYCYFALLPSYLERNTSSLIYMIRHFIELSGCGNFYKENYDELYKDISNYNGNKKIIIFGVTYALMQFCDNYLLEGDFTVIETGGMKGRGEELPRDAVHDILKNGFNTDVIFSEYGMTELFSQAYSSEFGIFGLPPSMKILIQDIYDPYNYLPDGKQGKINIMDLANFDSCSFISTDDLGVRTADEYFKILGRTDASDVRGCNLLFS